MDNHFPKTGQKLTPTIYAYTDSDYTGMLKVGYTARNAKQRVAEQYPILKPGARRHNIVLEESAIRDDGSTFTDHDVRRVLKDMGKITQRDHNNTETEWVACSKNDVIAAILAVKNGTNGTTNRTLSFNMRPEQNAAVTKTIEYFHNSKMNSPDRTPHFLWNAKMRFGKTFAAYQLAKKMGWKKILVLTFKPAVESAWAEDISSHIDFNGWQFVSKKSPLQFNATNPSQPLVCFGSFQDYLGKSPSGGIKAKNTWVHDTKWDCVIFDEYHYGAWRDTAKDLFDGESKTEIKISEGESRSLFPDDVVEEILPITTDHYLYLSGTPFRAISSGEFIEDQIFNWTYSNEQDAKETWDYNDGNNPYESLPNMVLLTYQMPKDIKKVADGGEFNEFDLNVFFSAKGDGDNAKFTYENEVQKWLHLIRGGRFSDVIDNLKLGINKPQFPFSDTRFLESLTHTFWFMPSVASCFAMKNLIAQNQNTFYHDYKIIVAAGNKAGMGVEALEPVRNAMGNPLTSKSITLSCGKLTTGVSVKPWSGIFMLRNLSSPETYFQAAFRVQTPWVINNEDGLSPNETTILKEKCYIFDFAPNRALGQITDYSCRLNTEGASQETKVEEFIHFLPVIAYDGISMKELDAASVLEFSMSGTSAVLLAKRWGSDLMVNVNDETLKKILNNKQAYDALMKIVGFRNLNTDLNTIINKSEAVKKAKKEANDDDITKTAKKKLNDADKEHMSLRNKIKKKLKKFATRIPVFMYLTNDREECLEHIIQNLEQGLFKEVTGLDVSDFNLLMSLNVFNHPLMDDAIYKFKRYEDASLNYTGLKIGSDNNVVGGFTSSMTRSDFDDNY